MIALIFFVFVFIILLYFYSKAKLPDISFFRGNSLIVVAHPDDECMFFAPTLLNITTKFPRHLFILCLSNGNYFGLGTQREFEFRKSISLLGIPNSNCRLINHPNLQDGPDNCWNTTLIAEIILLTIETYRINRLFTFDTIGVSGHRNHCDIACAIFLSKDKFRHLDVYFLQSVSALRKYMGMLEWICALVSPNVANRFRNDLRGLIKTYRAMYSHRSQFTWYRVLYIIFSRYVFINDFKQVLQVGHHQSYQ